MLYNNINRTHHASDFYAQPGGTFSFVDYFMYQYPITLSLQFLLFNGYLGIAQNLMKITENISYHVAAGKISKELLHKIMTAIMDGSYEKDEELKLEIMNAIA